MAHAESKSRRKQVIVAVVAIVGVVTLALGGVAAYKLTRKTGGACESSFSCPFGHTCISKKCAAHCDEDDDCPRGSECTRSYISAKGSDTDYDPGQQRVCWPPVAGESRGSLREKNRKPVAPMDQEADTRLAGRVRRALNREFAGSDREVAEQEFDAVWGEIAPSVKRSHGVVELARQVARELGIELPSGQKPSP